MNLARELETIAKRYRLRALYVFGSRAEEIAARLRGEKVHPVYHSSDLDVGMLPPKGEGFPVEERVGLAVELEDLLTVPRVDLVVLPEAPPLLAAEVVAGVCVYREDPDDEAEYELYVLRRAGDLEPLERERVRALLGVERK